MKITFIQPYYENVWEALGIGYIISYCKQKSGEKHDYRFFHVNFDDAAVPEDVIKEDSIDQVIVGEGEMAMVKVILGNRKPILQGIKLELDELYWPDRVAIKNERTVDLCEEMIGERIAAFQLNRGCKVHCAFCSERLMTGKYNARTNPIRTRDFDDLLAEIDEVAYEYRLTKFKFVDATFDRDSQTVISFCKAKIERGMILPWEANIHPSFVQNESVFKWLAEANCQQINVGVESGSPKILTDVGKGTSVDSIKKVFAYAKKYGIERRGYFLLGMPNETIDDQNKTIELIDEIKPEVVGFTILAPYPGGDFYDPIKHKDVDWSKVDEYSNDVWYTKYFTNDELKQTQRVFKEHCKTLLCERQK